MSDSHYVPEAHGQTVRPEQPSMPAERGADTNRDVAVDPYVNQNNIGVIAGVIILVAFAVIALVVFASTGTTNSSML
ncbi:hypothetical protein [Natronoglycomyces albus]|uniref:Uncharacterized protein n=1 Tax=Natronoglycomyces albus TaxID=2811108 RepID=A0A895XKI3_9ACTN|nr:hypothetical protein [Natronoglycomyces albus]QSB04322.1 hypothetical protein JQS30_10990 [Natronoglycomyces albus]